MALAAEVFPRSYQTDDFEGYMCNPRACSEHDQPAPHCRCGVRMEGAVSDDPMGWLCFWCEIEEKGFNLAANPEGLHAVFMYLSTDMKARINGKTGIRF